MTSTNDGKDVKSNQTSAPKGKTYFIELYKSLEARLSEGGASERTQHLCEAWRRVHTLCLHSAPSTHNHLLSWLQRHTARTVLQTEWQTDKRKDDRKSLNDAIDDFIAECDAAKGLRGASTSWEEVLVERGEWFKRMLERPWDHPVLTLLLNPSGDPPTDDEVLKWLKEERGVTFVSRLYTLVGEKCDDIAMSLIHAVMERARVGLPPVADTEDPPDAPPQDNAAPTTFRERLKEEADFTPDVWDTLTDIEFVLLHKRDSKRCIALAKQTPLHGTYYLLERLHKRLETSPREKRLWKNAKEVSILIAQVVIARCMVVPTCVGHTRTALYCCARLLARLLAARLPSAADALANQAPTARHLHTLAQAVDKQVSETDGSMKPYVCELYIRAITAGMNELERLKIKTEKEMEARSMEKTLASWFVQLGEVLSRSDRIMCECALTAFSLHPSRLMYELLDKAPQPAPVTTDSDETKEETVKSEFGSWASDSRSQTNFVKTSETLNLKQTQNQANVLSTAIFNEGEALGLSPELCQDLAVLLSGPRVKTLSWDMDRTLLLENCRTYSERTHGGTKVLTRELKYLNIDPTHYQHLPEERDEDENDPYYGIERGYEHQVPEEPEDIWKYPSGVSKTETSSSSIEDDFVAPRRKKKNKKTIQSSDEDSDPLSYMAEAKRVQKKKERPHSKERSKERAKKKPEELVDPLDISVQNTQNQTKKEKPKKERKKKEKSTSKFKGGLRNSLANLLGVKVKKTGKKPAIVTAPVATPVTDSDYDSQGKCSLTSVNSEGYDPDGLHESFSPTDKFKNFEPQKAHSFGGVDSIKKSEYQTGIGKARIPVQNPYRPPNNLTRLPYVPPNPNVRGQSPVGFNRALSPNMKYTTDVRSSLTKLLEIRQQRAAMELKLRQNTPLTTPRKPAIIRPNVEIQANVTPKSVTIPEIPKSYIKNEHAEKLAELKREVDNILAQRREKKSDESDSVIQYAKKIGSNVPPSRATTSVANTYASRNFVQQPNTNPLKMTDFVDVSYDRLMAEIAERQTKSNYNDTKPPKTEPQHQLGQLQRSLSVLTPGQRDYQNFLREYDRNKYAIHDHALDMSAKKTVRDGKKEILPISRVEPLIPKAVKKPGPKTMQCAKQSPLVKKPEASLNTFSRLSYMHKNKQIEIKNKNSTPKPPFTTSNYQDVSSELDQIIKDHQQAQMRVIQQAKKLNEKGKSLPRPLSTNSSQGAPQTSQTTKEHPYLTNLLQTDLMSPPGASMSRNMIQMKNDNVQLKPVLPPKTSLSDKDQSEILNLLRQQNKLNSSTNRIPGPSCAASINSSPMSKPNNVVTNKVSSMSDHNSVSTQKKQFARPVSQANNSYQSTIENKLINIISNTLIKQQSHVVSAPSGESNKLVASGTKNVKTTGQQDIEKKATANIGLVKKKPVNASEPETPEWQTVMSDLLRHKTPSRGPDALDVALNKNSFELAYEKSLQTSSMTSNNFQQQRKTDMPKLATTLVRNVIITNKGLKIQNTKSQKTEFNIKTHSITKKSVTAMNEQIKQNPSETSKKLPQDVQRKQFTYAGPKHDDPFISGIPNSDYDLLDELMDDDLRKEIGELSSDEESYNAAAQSFLKPTKMNEKRVSVQFNHSLNDMTTKKTTTDMGCLNARQPSRENMHTVAQKPVIQCVKKIVPTPHGIGAVKVPQNTQNAANNKTQGNIGIVTLTNQVASVHIPVGSNTQNQAYSNIKSFPQNQVVIDPNIYISVPQQQAPMHNVMLVGSELIYDRYSTVPTSFHSVSNLAASANVPLNNVPHVALCQTAQFATPVTSSLIIGGSVSMPINHVSCDTIPVQPTVIINLAQSSLPATFVKATNTKSETPVPDLQENNQIFAKAKIYDPAHIIENTPQKRPMEENKASERKVLSEVQKLVVNEKVDKVRNHEIENDMKKRTSANEERLMKKRLAIINRKISYECKHEPIPLSYSPLFGKTLTLSQQQIMSEAIPLPYTPLNINKDKQKLSDYEEDKLITQIKNNLKDLSDSINDVKSPATPDSIESKENKSLPTTACRRIMLRSSNRITNSIGEPIESSTNKKSKVKLKSNSAEGAAKLRDMSSHKKGDDKNANLPKRASKRLRSKTLTKEDKTQARNSNRKPSPGVKLAPKIEIKSRLEDKIDKPVLSSINNDVLFDIESELLGTTITKPLPELRRKKSIELKDHELNIVTKAIKNQPHKVLNNTPADLNVDSKIAEIAAINEVKPIVSDTKMCIDEKPTSVTDTNSEKVDATAQDINKQIDDMPKDDTIKITEKQQVENKPITRSRSKSNIWKMPSCIVLVEKLAIDKIEINISQQSSFNSFKEPIINNEDDGKVSEIQPSSDAIERSEATEMQPNVDSSEHSYMITKNESKNLEFLRCNEIMDTSLKSKNECKILRMPSIADAIKISEMTNQNNSKDLVLLPCDDGIETLTISDNNESIRPEIPSCVEVISSEMNTKNGSKDSEILMSDNIMEILINSNEDQSVLETPSSDGAKNINTTPVNDSKYVEILKGNDIVENSNSHDKDESEGLVVTSRADFVKDSKAATKNEAKDPEILSCDDLIEIKDESKVSEAPICNDVVDSSTISSKNELISEIPSAIEGLKATEHVSLVTEMPLGVDNSITIDEIESNVSEILVTNNIENQNESDSKYVKNIEPLFITKSNDIIARYEDTVGKLDTSPSITIPNNIIANTEDAGAKIDAFLSIITSNDIISINEETGAKLDTSASITTPNDIIARNGDTERKLDTSPSITTPNVIISENENTVLKLDTSSTITASNDTISKNEDTGAKLKTSPPITTPNDIIENNEYTSGKLDTSEGANKNITIRSSKDLPEKDSIDLDMTVTCEEFHAFKQIPAYVNIKTARNVSINIEKSAVKSDEIKENSNPLLENELCSKKIELAPALVSSKTNEMDSKVYDVQNVVNLTVSTPVTKPHSEIKMPVSSSHSHNLETAEIDDDVIVLDEDLNSASNAPEDFEQNKEDSPSLPDVNNASDISQSFLKQNKQVSSSLADVDSASDIPQSFKDSIQIDPLPSDDPLKKCVRVSLPNGRKFKATVYGEVHVTFDTLFTYPSIKSTLLNGLNCKKFYTMNIKQITTVAKSDPSKILSAQILDIKTATPTEPTETINLLSDDEDECAAQVNKKSAQTFKTEFGKYIISPIDDAIFLKHQDKLNQKSKILLNKVDAVDELPIRKVSENNILQAIPNQYVTGLINDIEKNLTTKNKSIGSNEVVEIDDSSNDSCEVVDQDGSIELENKQQERTLNELKNVLLKELGVEEIKPPKNISPVNQTKKVVVEKGFPSNKNLSVNGKRKLSEIPSGKSCPFDDLIREDQLNVTRRRCYIKLTRCDSQAKIRKIDEQVPEQIILEVSDDEVQLENAPNDVTIVIPDDVSVLNSLDNNVVESAARSSSPIIELSDVLALDSKIVTHSETAVQRVFSLECKAYWFTTKHMIHLDSKSRGSEYSLINLEGLNTDGLVRADLIDRNLNKTPGKPVVTNEISAEEKRQIQSNYAVPSLISLVFKYFQNQSNQTLHRYILLRNATDRKRICPLKRKYLPLENSAAYKVPKLKNETIGRKLINCDPTSTVVPDVSVTSTDVIPTVEDIEILSDKNFKPDELTKYHEGTEAIPLNQNAYHNVDCCHENVCINQNDNTTDDEDIPDLEIVNLTGNDIQKSLETTVIVGNSSKAEIDCASEVQGSSPVIEIARGISLGTVIPSKDDNKADIDRVCDVRSSPSGIETSNISSSESIVIFKEIIKTDIDSDSKIRSPLPLNEIARVMSSETMITYSEESDKANFNMAREAHSPAPEIEIVDKISSVTDLLSEENENTDIVCASEARFTPPVLETAHVMSQKTEILSKECNINDVDRACQPCCSSPMIDIIDILSPDTMVISEENYKTDVNMADEIRSPLPVIEIAHEMSPETIILSKESNIVDTNLTSEVRYPAPAIETVDNMSLETMDISEDDDKNYSNISSETRAPLPGIESVDNVSTKTMVQPEESKQTNTASVSEPCCFSPKKTVDPETMIISEESNKADTDLINEAHSPSSSFEILDKMPPQSFTISEESDRTDIEMASNVFSHLPVIQIADKEALKTIVISKENKKFDVDITIGAHSPSPVIKTAVKIPSETVVIPEETDKADVHIIDEAPAAVIEIINKMSPKSTVSEEIDKVDIGIHRSTTSIIEIADVMLETVIKPEKNKTDIYTSDKARSLSPTVEIAREIFLERKECIETDVNSTNEVLSPSPASTTTIETSSVTMAMHENEKAGADSSSEAHSSCLIDVADEICIETVIESTEGDNLDISMRNEDRSPTSTIDIGPLHMHSEILITGVNENSSASLAKDINVLFENEVGLKIFNNKSNNETCDAIEMRLAEIVGESVANDINDKQEENVQENCDLLKERDNEINNVYRHEVNTDTIKNILNADDILERNDNKILTDNTGEKYSAITDHEYVTSYNMSPKPDYLDEKDAELYEVIYVTTDDISFLSQNEPIKELEEEIFDMHSDEILGDISFDLNKTGNNEDEIADFATQGENISATDETNVVQSKDTKLEIVEEKSTSNVVNTETIISKYLTLIKSKSKVFEGVDKYKNSEIGPCYVIPVIDTPVGKNTENITDTIQGYDSDDIEKQLAKIVGEPLDVKDQNVKTVMGEKYNTSYTENVDVITMPEMDFENIQKILETENNLEVIMPKHTYAKTTALCNEQNKKSLKRKLSMADVKTSGKKYRKGKNIDYPKITALAMSDSTYAKEYNNLMNYCSSVKFSFAVPFHKTHVDVFNLQKSWPIKTNYSEIAEDPLRTNIGLFTEIEKSEALLDPLEQSLSDEMNSQYDENSYTHSNIDETNFKMGFGEGSGRVIQEIRDGEQTTLSAATLSDVKQFQPLLPSDELEVIEKQKINGLSNEQRDQRLKTKRFVDHLNLTEKVRSFFKKRKEDLILDSLRSNKKERFSNDFTFSNLMSTESIVPPSVPSDKLEAIEKPKLNRLLDEQNKQPLKTTQFVDHLNLTEKVRSFFKKRKEDLILNSLRSNKEERFGNDFPFSNLTSAESIVPPSVPSDKLEAIEKPKLNSVSNKRDQRLKSTQFVDYLNLTEKVRTFFKKRQEKLIFDSLLRINRNVGLGNSIADFPFSNFTSTDYLVPPSIEVVVNVVQVGQCPVSAAAQNPVTCDPRVTHVSNASPQCSPENSSGDDLQTAIKTEYTELTTANITLPLMQEYAQHHHSMPTESQESNLYNTNDNTSMSTQIKSVVKIELMEETSQEIDENADYEYDGLQQLPNGNANNDVQYPFNVSNNITTEPDPNSQGIGNSTKNQTAAASISEDKLHNEVSDNSNQIVNAMNAAGISETQALTKINNAAPVDTIPQSIRSDVATSQINTGSYTKSTPITAMALQQALAQMLPSPLNQTNTSENNQHTSTNPPVLHIVQGNNSQTVINKPNGTQLLHIVQNKSAATTNGTPTSQQSSFSGLSLVDGAIQQNGNQLLHIVNTGNQKNNNAGQLLKRVNLLTNLANVQGGNEQKIVQFVCKSADGKSIQLPHQRSMVLRLQPLDPTNVPATPKQSEPQDLTPSSSSAATVNDKESNSQEMKSRSLYEENYAKFVQNGDSKVNPEKATSLPKFNQVFGKQVYQDKQNDIENGNLQENSECPPDENNIQLEQMNEINNPPMLIRKPQPQSAQAQPNLVQQIKQTVGHSNIQTMHGGVIYTRQVPVNLGNGQTINLITVPSTEVVDDSTQKQKADGKFSNQEEDASVVKIVPTNQSATTTNGTTEDNVQMRSTNEASPQNNPQPQPQPVLTQMRIKLPMLSKAPHMVGGTRVVRPAFFQIQRNIVGGANQQVYQQLVLTAAPPLGQSIRVPAPTPKPKTPSETQSSPESQMSSSTLEQLREFDMVLEQVKERSTVQPGTSASTSNNSYSKSKSSPDTTDAPTPSTSTKESTTPVLYSVGTTQPLNMVNYVNRKSTITSTTTSSYVRSPDSTGVSDSPSSSTTSHLPQSISSESCASSSCASEAAATTPAQSKPKKKKSKPSTSNSNPFNIKNTPKPSTQKPLEDEQTTQRILYILAEYKEQVENSPDKDKPAPRRRNNPAAPNAGSSKRKKSSSGSRRRDMSPVMGEESCRTMGSEDSSCGTSMGECNECLETHSPEESPKKVVRRLTFEQETPTNVTQTRTIPQRNVIVADGQAFAVRNATGKPATTVLMPANYLLPVSMVKGGQQIAIVTNRGPKLLVGAGEGGAGGALLFQRLIGPGGLKPVLARPGVRHIRLPTAALHNLQAFNIATPATAAQPPDSTASPAPATTPPDLVDTRAMSSPWPDREAGEVKPERGNSSPEGSEPWNLPSSSIADDYGYEEIVRTDNMDRTVLVVQRKDGRHTRLTHVSSAALRHKYAILEHELRLQKSLSEECEDLGVDSPSASELFPEAELLFAPSPAHEQTIDQCHTPTILTQGIPQPDLDDQIATDHLLTHKERHDDLDLNLDDVGEIVTVGEDGMTTIPLDHEEFARSHEEFARSHPNTTFHSEPEDGEIPPFTIAQGIKGRPVAFHSRGVPGTVVMAPQTTVISQATVEASGTQNAVKFTDIDNIINSMPSPQNLHNTTLPPAPAKERNEGLTKFDRLLNESRELHLSNTASAIVHSTGNGTQVIRRVHYDTRRDARFLVDERDALIADENKTASDNRNVQSAGENDASSPERHPELFWESNPSARTERRYDFSSDSDKCCKSPYDDANSDSSGVGVHTRLDSVIKAARTERRRSEGSSDESHPPLRTYPAKRQHQAHGPHQEERAGAGRTRSGDRCDESRRRASNRGVVKRGCHCCNGSSAPPKPKKSRKKSDYPHN